MVIGWGPRLVALLLLLFFQIICIASEIVFFRKRMYLLPTDHDDQLPGQESRYSASLIGKAKRLLDKPDISRAVIPLLSTVFGVITTSAIFSSTSDTHGATGNACGTNLDADISGVGVRVSIWLQIGMLLVISISGHLHKRDTGIKEVGGGLILTHVALTIALVVQMHKGTLTSVDAAIGAVILDAQNVALHIPGTAKQTLAARWQVLLLVPAQIMGLVFLPVLVIKLIKGGFASEDCQCLNFFWWSRLSDCGAFSGNELSLFWIYYTLRWIMWIQSSFHSMYNTQPFHESERDGRALILRRDGTKPKTDKEIIALEWQAPERRVKKATIQAGLVYKQYPATLSVSYMTYALYSLTSMVVAEVTIREYDLQPSSNVYSIGQIVAIVVSLATLIRATWSFQSLYIDFGDKSFPDFVFSLLCCFGSREDETGEDPSATSLKQNGEEPRTGSDTDGENDRAGGRRPPRPPTQTSSSTHEVVGQPQPYPGRYPGSLHPNNSRQSSDSTNLSNPQLHSPLEQDRRAQRPQPDQSKSQQQRRHFYKPIYRLKFRQPFHLDAVKQLFLPAFTQYLEERKQEKVAAPKSEIIASPLIEPPTTDQPMACTSSQQSRHQTGREGASSPSIVEAAPSAEALISDDNQHPVMTSGKPPDVIGVKKIPEHDNPDVTDQPENTRTLEDLQPQSAARREMDPGSIPTQPEQEQNMPTVALKVGEPQPESIQSSVHSEKVDVPEYAKVSKAAKPPERAINPIPASHSLQEVVRQWQALRPDRELRDRSRTFQPPSDQVSRDFTQAGANWQRVIQKIRHQVRTSNSGIEDKSAVAREDTLLDSTPLHETPIGPSVQGSPDDEPLSVHIEGKRPTPVSIFGDGWIFPANRSASKPDPTLVDLKSGTNYPGVADESKGSGEPQEAEVQSEKGRALVVDFSPTDAESHMDNIWTIHESEKSPYLKRLHYEAGYSPHIEEEEDLREMSGQGRAARQWDRVLKELGVFPRKELTPDYLKREFMDRWRAGMKIKQERDRRNFAFKCPRSGCPGVEGKCEQSGIVWGGMGAFLSHFVTHATKTPGLLCPKCGKSHSSPDLIPGAGELARLALHIWNSHMHKVDRDPLSLPLPEAEKGKEKPSEASKAESSERVDAEVGELDTATDRNVF